MGLIGKWEVIYRNDLLCPFKMWEVIGHKLGSAGDILSPGIEVKSDKGFKVSI